jgi:DNA-binding Xre family transcriptional regulator
VGYNGNMSRILDTIGDALAACGQTQLAIKATTGVDQGTISELVNHKSEGIAIETADHLCDYLGLRLVKTEEAVYERKPKPLPKKQIPKLRKKND